MNKYKKVTNVMAILVAVLVGSAHGDAKVAENEGFVRDLLKVELSKKAVISITDVVVRESVPTTLFGFNINYVRFQKEYWDVRRNSVEKEVRDQLTHFPGALYRYPGGLVANNFDWREAIDPLSSAQPMTAYGGWVYDTVQFGLAQFLDFATDVDGRPWYVLNLGLDRENPLKEVDLDKAAKSNKSLAIWMKKKRNEDGFPRYYQLGNELDRYKHEWSMEKYVERSKVMIDAIKSVDPEARFVAFFRDFRWRYKKDKDRQASDPWEFMVGVLKGLPIIEDYSIHKYYDGVGRDSRVLGLEKIVKSIEVYKVVRGGNSPRVWITEYARQRTGPKMKSADEWLKTNLQAAISSADYLTGLVQIPEVAGACLHIGGFWSPFGVANEPPKPLYQGLRVLRSNSLPIVLATKTYSPNKGRYKGGYDIRSAAFRSNDGKNLALWVINRADTATLTEVHYPTFSGVEVTAKRSYIAGEVNKSPDDKKQEIIWEMEEELGNLRFSDEGKMDLLLPANSVSTIVLQR